MTLGVEYAGKEGKSVETRERSAFRRLTIRQAFSISHFAKPLQTCFVKFSRFSVQNIAGRLINPADWLIARGSNREGRRRQGGRHGGVCLLLWSAVSKCKRPRVCFTNPVGSISEVLNVSLRCGRKRKTGSEHLSRGPTGSSVGFGGTGRR
jgi:hypothetical protein